VLQPVKADGVLPTFIAPNRTLPMVSVLGIGKALAQALLDRPPGTRIIELSGPVDVSPNDVAESLGKILSKPIKIVNPPFAAVVPTFTSFGMSQNIAELFREMYEGIENGKARGARAKCCAAARRSKPRSARCSGERVSALCCLAIVAQKFARSNFQLGARGTRRGRRN
jgi:hypothetical protein